MLTSSREQRIVLEWKKRKIDFSARTYIMGILNVTPDSFSDGGNFLDREKAVEQALRMEEEGADIIDIGGESTRPGATPVSADEELRRVIPVLKEVVKKVKVIVSIDTTKAAVAEQALTEGAEIVNDVSALRFDPDMALLVAMREVPVVLMHMRGTPQSMQTNTDYHDVVCEIKKFLNERISFAKKSGIEQTRLIVDPGIGFGKSLEKDNFAILNKLEELTTLGTPILVGPSRKTFLRHLLNTADKELKEATAAAVAVAVMKGANIVRVHDVKHMKQVVRVVDAIKGVH